MAELPLTRHASGAPGADAGGGPAGAPATTFYYDLGSAECYLVAERIHHALPVIAEWQPVLAARLPAFHDGGLAREEVERRAAARALQPLRWPARRPPDTRAAMLAATYAKRIGRVVAFSLAAFRQAFAGGRDLSDPDTVLIAAAACEMHPAALAKATATRSVTAALDAAGEGAAAAGVHAVPALRVGTVVFHGDDGLEAAAAVLPAG